MYVEDRKSHFTYRRSGKKKNKPAEQTLTKLFPLGFASVSPKLECNASEISAARPPLGAACFPFKTTAILIRILNVCFIYRK